MTLRIIQPSQFRIPSGLNPVPTLGAEIVGGEATDLRLDAVLRQQLANIFADRFRVVPSKGEH